MKAAIVLIISFVFLFSKEAFNQQPGNKFLSSDSIPAALLGNFIDDYAIHYKISDSLWIQLPGTKYHVVKWNTAAQYVITRNDNNNQNDAGLYTRIDYMKFENMKPYVWGYCFTTYNAKTDKEAELTAAANRLNPKKGCGGFPFSRMKKEE